RTPEHRRAATYGHVRHHRDDDRIHVKGIGLELEVLQRGGLGKATARVRLGVAARPREDKALIRCAPAIATAVGLGLRLESRREVDDLRHKELPNHQQGNERWQREEHGDAQRTAIWWALSRWRQRRTTGQNRRGRERHPAYLLGESASRSG